MAKKVLVVDDEKLIVKGIRFSLEQDGMEVDCAYDGEEALNMVKEKEYDIVLLDACPPPATRKAMCGTLSMLMRPTGSTPVTMWPGTAPHGMCWPVRWTCPPTCLRRTLWPFPTQSWIISASKGGQ